MIIKFDVAIAGNYTHLGSIPQITSPYTRFISVAIGLIMGFLCVFTHQKILAFISLFLDATAKILFVSFALLFLTVNVFTGSTIEHTTSSSKPLVPTGVSPDIFFPQAPVLIVADPSIAPFMEKFIPHIYESFERLPTAQVLHNISNKMKLGIKETIQVSISKEITEEMFTKLQRTSNRKGKVKKGVHYDPRGVEMTLIAEIDEFRILPIKVGKQYVILDKPTEWSWEITPLKPGNNLLVLNALVDFYVPELEKPLVESVEIFNDKVLVKSNFYYILKQDLYSNRRSILIFILIIGLMSRLTNFLQVGIQKLVAENRKINPIFNNYFQDVNIGNLANQIQDNARQQANQHNYAPEQKQTLSEAAAQIQRLLKQLEENNPTATEAEKQAYVTNSLSPKFRERAVSALKAGGKEALKEMLDNPYVNIGVAIVEGWQNPE